MRFSLLASVLVLASCTTTRNQMNPAPEPDSGITTESQAGVELSAISRLPKEEVQSLGGPNKPNGIEYRYRRWVSPRTPAFVPRTLDSLELAIADQVEDGWLTLYVGPFQPSGANQAYQALLFSRSGERIWELELNPLFSRSDQIEVQDIRYADSALYFNEACQSYALEADGACSSLVKVDPTTGNIEWRTPHLISNDIFILHGPYVIAGYGFTAEPDYLYLIDRDTGNILSRVPLDSAHDYLEVDGETLHVVTYNEVYHFSLPSG